MGQLIYAFLYTVEQRIESRQGASRLADLRQGTSRSSVWRNARHVQARSRGVHEGATRRFPRPLGRFRVAQRQLSPRLRATATTRRFWAKTPDCAKSSGDFLDKYPGSAFQGVNGGGQNAGYDYARYSSSVSFSDGAVGILRNYYASLLLPPDKSSDIPDVWNPGQLRQGHLARAALHQLRHDRRHLGSREARRASRADRHLSLLAQA